MPFFSPLRGLDFFLPASRLGQKNYHIRFSRPQTKDLLAVEKKSFLIPIELDQKIRLSIFWHNFSKN
jgi:hypothetical protein